MKRFLDRLLTKTVELFAKSAVYYSALVAFCILYTAVITRHLKEYYYVGDVAVVSYQKNFSIIRFIVCMVMVIFMATLVRTFFKKNDIPTLVMNMLFFVYAVPVILYYCIVDKDNSLDFFVLFSVYWLLVCVVSKYLLYDVRLSTRHFFQWSGKVYKYIYMCLVIFLVVYMVYRQEGFHLAKDLFSGAYKQRAAYKASNPGVWAYIKLACGDFICPALIAYYLKRNLKVSVLFMFMQILLFSLAREKAYFFLIAVAILIGLTADKIEGNYNKIYTILAVTYALLCLLPLLGLGTSFFLEVIVRREMFMPSWLNYLYYDYFSGHMPIWWRQDTFLIDKLFTPPYSVTTSKLIDIAYFDSMVGNPNSGMFAEAISRCGYPGILIYPWIFALLLKFIRHFSRNSAPQIKIMYAFSLCLVFQNDVVTSTGLVIAIVMMAALTLIFNDRTDMGYTFRSSIRAVIPLNNSIQG